MHGSPSLSRAAPTFAATLASYVALVLFVAIGLTGTSAAQTCVNYQGYMHVLSDGPNGGDDVVIVGSYAYVADSGLEVYDISGPIAPVLIGSVSLPFADGMRLAVAGSHAYIAGYDLYIIDISNPAGPVLTGSVVTPGNASDVAVNGVHAYIANGTAGLTIADVSNPAAPFVVGSVDTPGTAQGVELAGSRAYVADGSAGLSVIDVANPAAPLIVGAVDTPGFALDVAVAATRAYIADYWPSGLVIADISIASAPVIVGSVHTPGYASRIVLQGCTAFLVDRASSGALQTVDVSDPVHPRLAGRVATPASSVGVALSGSRAFVVEQAISIGELQGLRVIDITNPTSPVALGSTATAARAMKVALAGGHAYVAELPSGLQVFDVTTSPPVQVGSAPAGPGYDIAVAGNRVYIADSPTLEIFDISNPAIPIFIRNVGTPAQAVVVSGSYAYVATGSRLDIVDVSNAAAAAVVGTVDVGGQDVAIFGNVACIAGYQGLTTIDVTDRRAPRVLGSTSTGFDWSIAVAMSGLRAYVATTEPGPQALSFARCYVVDLSAPTSPTVIQRLPLTGGYAFDVVVAGSSAYVSEGDVGIEVVDLSNLAAPSLAGGVVTPGIATGLAVNDGWVCIAAREAGIHVVPAQCVPTAVEPQAAASTRGWYLLPAAPNPMRTQTTFRFDAPRAGFVELRVFDPGGRVVRTLLSAPVLAGRGVVAWDGRDARGRRLPGGVYFVRLDCAPGSSTQRVTVLP